jgi:hypothetical protein
MPEDLVCAESGLYKLPTLQKLDRWACWRLYREEDSTYAFLDGPVVLEVERGREVDLRRYAAELGWHFPLGLPRVTDFARFGDVLAAAVEVGNLMAGYWVDSLRPLDFAEDQHNLLAFGRSLLVATASGIYVSQDLRSFKQVEGSEGYAHALENCQMSILSVQIHMYLYIGKVRVGPLPGYLWLLGRRLYLKLGWRPRAVSRPSCLVSLVPYIKKWRMLSNFSA